MDKTVLLVGRLDKTFDIIDSSNEVKIQGRVCCEDVPNDENSSQPNCIIVSDNLRYVFVGGFKIIFIYEWSNFQKACQHIKVHNDNIVSLIMINNVLLAGSEDKTASRCFFNYGYKYLQFQIGDPLKVDSPVTTMVRHPRVWKNIFTYFFDDLE
jgi:hypothetical protein